MNARRIVSRTSARFDPAELRTLTQKTLHKLDFEDVRERLAAHFAGMGAKILMEGRIGETIRFYYLDTEPMLKVIFESGTGHAVDLKPARVYP